MKRSLSTFFAALSAVALVLSAMAGCSPKKDFLPQLEIALADGGALAGSSVNHPFSGGETKIRIACNAAWKIDCESSWVYISSAEGRGDAEVVVSTGGTEDSRSAVVTVGMSGFPQLRHSFDIVQHAAPLPELPDVPEEPADPSVTDMSISRINAMMPAAEGRVVADAAHDIRFEADVQNYVPVGNYPSGWLFLTEPEGLAAGNGICLAGESVDPAACGLDSGATVTVTLHAGKAELVNDGGMLYVTGDDDWVTIERGEADVHIIPCSADLTDLQGYIGMTVRIHDATPASAGVWCTEEDGCHEFSAHGAEFDVYVRARADAFAGKMFDRRTSAISGIIAVHEGRVRLYPRDLNDIYGYNYEVPPVTEHPAGDYTEVTSVAQLSAGTYYLGGYQGENLHLASGGLTPVGHANTVRYCFGADGTLSPVGSRGAVEVVLTAAEEENGYHIRFVGDGYLTATASGAGQLAFSSAPGCCWIFADHPDGGFDVRQQGDAGAKLIISDRASSAFLRSVAADEEGNPIVLFRRNAAAE